MPHIHSKAEDIAARSLAELAGGSDALAMAQDHLERGISQVDLARRFKMSQPSVSRRIRGVVETLRRYGMLPKKWKVAP